MVKANFLMDSLKFLTYSLLLNEESLDPVDFPQSVDVYLVSEKDYLGVLTGMFLSTKPLKQNVEFNRELGVLSFQKIIKTRKNCNHQLTYYECVKLGLHQEQFKVSKN